MLTVFQHSDCSRPSPESTRGFTLMELLVAMTIFITIMASVTLMFNAVVRTTKIGYQNQRAYEVVRGVFDTIEADVTRAYTSRETGLKDTFYGTPYGFTFIGMIDADGNGNYNLARISYVIYSDSINVSPVTMGGEQGLRIKYTTVTDDDDFAADGTRLPDTQDVVTYSLLRYIEPGVDNLDSFPIAWGTTALNDAAVAVNINLQADYIDPLVNIDPLNPPLGTAVVLGVSDGSLGSSEAIERSIKCDLWLRMLGGDARLPHFWTSPSNGRSQIQTGNLANNDIFPGDYVLAENILHINRLTDQEIEIEGITDYPYNPRDYDTYQRFDVDVVRADGVDFPLVHDIGDDMAYIYLHERVTPPVPLPGDYIDFLNFQLYKPSAILVQDYYFTYREGGETNKLDSGNQTIQKVKLDGTFADDVDLIPILETVLTARDFAFWNDYRNLEHSVGIFDNDTPDVIDPMLPESIQIQFVLFYPSPYAGAPDFEKTFTHQINLPTAFRRKIESLDTKLLRDVD